MHTLTEVAKMLNRPVVLISGFQNRFELPGAQGAGYSDAYLARLRIIVYLRTLGIADDRLLRLWHLEKKLLQFLHVDSTGSETWFLDSCGAITGRDRRLTRAAPSTSGRAKSKFPSVLCGKGWKRQYEC